jgi:hypothetical protein
MTTSHPTSRVHDETVEPFDGVPAAASEIVAIAWPTGRPIRPYTVDELAEGVDLYTRAMKARAATGTNRGRRNA